MMGLVMYTFSRFDILWCGVLCCAVQAAQAWSAAVSEVLASRGRWKRVALRQMSGIVAIVFARCAASTRAQGIHMDLLDQQCLCSRRVGLAPVKGSAVRCTIAKEFP